MSKKKKDDSKQNPARYKSLKITVIYFLFGCVWIILSDMLSGQIFAERSNIVLVGIAKGLLYVSVTAAMVYRLNYSVLKKLFASQKKLTESETLFRMIFDQAPIGIAISHSWDPFDADADKNISVNSMYEQITGRTNAQLMELGWVQITHPDDAQKERICFQKFRDREINNYSMEKRYVKPDGSLVWAYITVAPLNIMNNTDFKYICLVQDITGKKEMEQKICESERSKSVLLANLPGMAYRCKYDRDWTMEFISEGCHELTGHRAESLLNNANLSFNDLIMPTYRELLWNEWARLLRLRKPFRYEYEIMTAGGEHKWVLETGQGIYGQDGAVEALEGIIIDITESKMRQNQIEYISDHDFMTGLYNRRYYEAEKARLDEAGSVPVSIIKADINGVRLINDAFGHTEGDYLIKETASLLKSLCRESDIAARTGGDEFAIILPDTDADKAYQHLSYIRQACDDLNAKIPEAERKISLSFGFGTKSSREESLEEAEKEADEYLRRRKLFEQKSLHNAMLSSIMATMYARSQETEEHSQRLSENCIKIAEKLGLSQSKQDELHLFAMLHDIGKIGIDDRILNKPGKLSAEEWAIMQTHPEIGYHIILSAPELAVVADYILAHHERWDGKGYPLGISGEDIPLLSRILAVADAYDAMTETRVYRKALPRQAAISEIQSHSGTQFDPCVVQAFIEIMHAQG